MRPSTALLSPSYFNEDVAGGPVTRPKFCCSSLCLLRRWELGQREVPCPQGQVPGRGLWPQQDTRPPTLGHSM